MDEQVWRVDMIGGLCAVRGDRIVDRFATRKTGALLARLAHQPDRVHSRDELLDLFWPDMDADSARHNLRQTLFSLRRVLERDSKSRTSVLRTDNSTVSLVPGTITTDVAEFEENLRAASVGEDRIDHLTRAAELYRGEFLAGYYDDWLLPERRRLEAAFLKALVELQDALLESGDPSAGIPYALRAISANPLEEHAHLMAMRLYAASGQTEAVRRQLADLERNLREDLDERPSESAASQALLLIAESERREAAIAAQLPEYAAGISEFYKRRRAPAAMAAGIAAFVLLILAYWGSTPAVLGSQTSRGNAIDVRIQQVTVVREKEFGAGPAAARSEARGRHARECLNLAEEAWKAWYGPDEDAWVKRLETAHDDLRLALRWYLEGDPAKAVQMAGALTRFWYLRDHGREGLRWLSEALNEAPKVPTDLRARALVGAAFLNPKHGPEAESKCREALAIYRASGDSWGMAHALRHLGYFASERVESRQARNLLEEALTLFTSMRDERGMAVTLLCLAFAPQEDSHTPIGVARAEVWGKRSLALFRMVGNAWGVSMALNQQADIARAQVRGHDSASLIHEALTLNPGRAALSVRELESRAQLAELKLDAESADRLYARAISVCRDQGDQINAARILFTSANSFYFRDSVLHARLLGASMNMDRFLGTRQDPVSRQIRDTPAAHLRANLGHERFESAYREGEQFDVDQVVDALSDGS